MTPNPNFASNWFVGLAIFGDIPNRTFIIYFYTKTTCGYRINVTSIVATVPPLDRNQDVFSVGPTDGCL